MSTRCSHSKGKITANINMASYISGWNKPAFLTALTVTCGAKQIPKSPAGRPHVDLCCLSQARTCTHAHTNTQRRVHAPRHGSQRRGRTGEEVLGWAAVRSSRNIRMFPLQQSAGISSKLTDRCFDSLSLSLFLSCSHSFTVSSSLVHKMKKPNRQPKHAMINIEMCLRYLPAAD